MGMFGEIFQNGYVVRDMEKALAHWIKTIGVGPFHIIDIDQPALVHGRELTVRTQMALAWWNNFQIELIMPLDDAPTPYKTFLDSGRQGLHHLACISKDFTRDDVAIRAAGIECVMLGEMPGTRIGYYRTDTEFAGTMIEVVEGSEFFLGLLSRMKAACTEWNGDDPVRPIERLFA